MSDIQSQLVEELAPLIDAVVDVEKRVDGIAGELATKDQTLINAKSYEAGGIYRAEDVVWANIGQLYKAVRDTTAEPGNSPDWERKGTAGLRFVGTRPKDDVELKQSDIYVDGGSLFLCVKDGEPGKMILQRPKAGKDGEKGEKGLDGIDGRDAPLMTGIEIKDGRLIVGFDDGSELSSDDLQLEDHVKALTDERIKLMPWYDTLTQQAQDDYKATPIHMYRGAWRESESYRIGDCVRYGNKLYLCIKNARGVQGLQEDYWKMLAGGGGGGGGGSGGWNYIATQQINMNRLQIVNMAPPRAGNVGQLDAVNRIFLESAIAAGSLFQGTVTELTQTNLPRLPDPTTKGHYWTWVGAANHVIGPADTTLNADLNGQLLQVGDWIQSNGVSWSHVPGDLLSKQRWQTLGGFTDWVAGQSYEVGSLVHYQGHLYRAETALTGAAGETAPNIRAQPIVISFGTVTVGKHYTITVSGGISTGNSVLNINLDVDDTPGIDTQTAPIIAGQTAANVAAAIVGGWSNTSTTAVLRLNTSIIDVNVVKQTDTITSLGINQTTLDAANSLGGNVQRWTDISPRMNLSDLADTGILQPAKSDHLIYDGTRWANKNPFVQMTKAAYTALGTNVDPDVLYLIKG